jgi:hypothetical protein
MPILIHGLPAWLACEGSLRYKAVRVRITLIGVVLPTVAWLRSSLISRLGLSRNLAVAVSLPLSTPLNRTSMVSAAEVIFWAWIAAARMACLGEAGGEGGDAAELPPPDAQPAIAMSPAAGRQAAARRR